MGGLRQLITTTFGESACLYKDVLHSHPKATSSELRKAYYKRAKCLHPDRQQMPSSRRGEQNKSSDTLRFQAVSATYEFLCESSNRSMYDSTGILDNDDIKSTDSTKMNRTKTKDEWTDFFHSVFQEFVTADDGMDREHFCGSSQEKKEVLKFYAICKGDLKKVATCILLAEEIDIPRWEKTILIPHIQRGDIIDFKGLLEPPPTISKKKRKKSQKTELQNDESRCSKSGSSRKKPKSKRGSTSRKRQTISVDNPVQTNKVSNVTKQRCSKDVLMDTDEEEEARCTENHIRKKIEREKPTKVCPFQSTDDEDENHGDERAKNRGKRKKTLTPASSMKQQETLATMSKRDKMEYRVARMQKQKKLKEVQLAKLIKGKQWDTKTTIPTKQRNHCPSFTKRFLSNLEQKFS